MPQTIKILSYHGAKTSYHLISVSDAGLIAAVLYSSASGEKTVYFQAYHRDKLLEWKRA